ncbi:RNA directed DNA polymerase [Echinococcus multilocularis]|uniref:RNA directed DNA polymerase n=1 Tax=Echinococcus multilocularis TaxID=6211 RepID=A0A0S4MIE7_ECHMU|nr:RNA directed DNA polymerase [Echinococcus multilocularis]
MNLYPRCQRIPLILRALPHGLFVAAVGAGITHDTDVDQCCDTLAQLVINRDEGALARDFFQRFQKADEADEEYDRNLQLLAECAFRGCPPNKIANWVTVQFKHGIRPPTLAEKLCKAKTNSLDQLVKLATKKRQELRGSRLFGNRETDQMQHSRTVLSCTILLDQGGGNQGIQTSLPDRPLPYLVTAAPLLLEYCIFPIHLVTFNKDVQNESTGLV